MISKPSAERCRGAEAAVRRAGEVRGAFSLPYATRSLIAEHLLIRLNNGADQTHWSRIAG